MKKLFVSLCSAASLVLGSPAAQAQTYQQVWADEFTNGIGPDWSFDVGNPNGWGNNELQYYQQANATVANGLLQITAKKETVSTPTSTFKYTSARMYTNKNWGYGKIEARIKVPMGNGLWAGFWTLGSTIGPNNPWPNCGEMDIMEHVNTSPLVVATEHWSGADGTHQSYAQNRNIGNPGDWHVYAVKRDANYIKTSVDGYVYNTFNISGNPNGTDEFQKNFFILLNLAVGGDMPFNFGDGVTAVDESKLPATMYVDYVRVSQLVVNPIYLEAESYSSMSGVQQETCTDTGGGKDVTSIDTKDYMTYNNLYFPVSGTYQIEYRVASPKGGQLSADLNAGSTPLGNLTVPATGGWQTWTTIPQTVTVNAGTYNLGVFAQAGGWNLNWLRITKIGSARPLATTTSVDPDFTADLYPNPGTAGRPLRLVLSNYDFAVPAEVEVTDLLGKVLLHKPVTASTTDLTLGTSLANGTYLVRISGGNRTLLKRVSIQ